MSTALNLFNGVPRTFTIPGTSLIYDQSVTMVASGGNGSTTLNGPISSGTAITLPRSGVYTLNTNSVPNLNVYLNGERLESTIDWNTSGSGPNFTAIQMTFQLVVGDRLDFRMERTS
jgi:hypothetical protein